MLKKRKDGKFDTGRPTAITSEVLLKLEQAFSLDCTDEEACVYADISPATLYNYQNKNPEFLERKKLLKQKLVLKAREVIAQSLQKKDRDTAKWYLERKKKAEFSTRQELTGEDGSMLLPKIEILPVAIASEEDKMN